MAIKKSEVPAKKKKDGDSQDDVHGKFQLAQIKEFTAEVKTEFGKISWPDKKHTVASAGVVIVLIMIISFYLGAVDLVLGKLISWLLN